MNAYWEQAPEEGQEFMRSTIDRLLREEWYELERQALAYLAAGISKDRLERVSWCQGYSFVYVRKISRPIEIGDMAQDVYFCDEHMKPLPVDKLPPEAFGEQVDQPALVAAI